MASNICEDETSLRVDSGHSYVDRSSMTEMYRNNSSGSEPTSPISGSEAKFFFAPSDEDDIFSDSERNCQNVKRQRKKGSVNAPMLSEMPATRPIPIPVSPQGRSNPRPRHPDHTPPRGYIRPGLPSVRFSTGCLQGDQLESGHQRTLSTQTRALSQSLEMQFQETVQIQEEAHRITERCLTEEGSDYEGSVPRVRTCSESIHMREETQAGPPLTPRDRSKSDPGFTMRRLHLERSLGQELRRISDEFHHERFGRGHLFRIPEDVEAVRSSSFPGSNSSRQGWWHRFVQYLSPNQVRPRLSLDDLSLPEPESGDRPT